MVEIEAAKAKINHQRAKIILEGAQQFLSDRQISRIELTHETGFLVDIFHELERDSDLIVLGKRGENANFASEHLGANMERIVRSSHKPCLVTPREYEPIQRVLLAYDGGKSYLKANEVSTTCLGRSGSICSTMSMALPTTSKAFPDF